MRQTSSPPSLLPFSPSMDALTIVKGNVRAAGLQTATGTRPARWRAAAAAAIQQHHLTPSTPAPPVPTRSPCLLPGAGHRFDSAASRPAVLQLPVVAQLPGHSRLGLPRLPGRSHSWHVCVGVVVCVAMGRGLRAARRAPSLPVPRTSLHHVYRCPCEAGAAPPLCSPRVPEPIVHLHIFPVNPTHNTHTIPPPLHQRLGFPRRCIGCEPRQCR